MGVLSVRSVRISHSQKFTRIRLRTQIREAIEVHSDNDVVQASALHGIYILFTVSNKISFSFRSQVLWMIYGVMKSKLSDPAIQDGA